MNTDIPYLIATGNLHKILDAIQRAGAPETFNVEFIKDLGFTSSQDRTMPRLLKYLGFLDGNGHPQAAYREFMDHTKAKQVLADRMRSAFDDLFVADKNAHAKTAEQLKGWFKTKTGAGDSVADKIARTFKSLATYADFSAPPPRDTHVEAEGNDDRINEPHEQIDAAATAFSAGLGAREHRASQGARSQIGLVYRFEIHLPDTQNVDTFRAIFRALREELM